MGYFVPDQEEDWRGKKNSLRRELIKRDVQKRTDMYVQDGV